MYYNPDKHPEIGAVNACFNDELSRQIAGTLPPGHIYRLGYPGRILRAAGLISLRLLKFGSGSA
ncbi:MAG: hypothetical protein K2K51_03360 [Bacteroidales bacterium]|nr:hypothetical protein [Bacteroidales bacterium]